MLIDKHYNKKEGIKYDEIFAPVANLESIWITLALHFTSKLNYTK